MKVCNLPPVAKRNDKLMTIKVTFDNEYLPNSVKLIFLQKIEKRSLYLAELSVSEVGQGLRVSVWS